MSNVSQDGKIGPELTFGELEAVLAQIHDVADNQRTKFQARLKNLHRIGFPARLQSSKGKATLYDSGLVFEMAIALELIELGMPPERVLETLNSKVAVGIAMAHSAKGLLSTYGISSARWAYLTLDPSALYPLSIHAISSKPVDSARVTLFCMNGDHLAQNVDRLAARSTRLSIIDATSLLNRIGTALIPTGLDFESFLLSLVSRGHEMISLDTEAGRIAATHYVARHALMTELTPSDHEFDHAATQLSEHLFLPLDLVREGIAIWLEIKSQEDEANGNSQT